VNGDDPNVDLAFIRIGQFRDAKCELKSNATSIKGVEEAKFGVEVVGFSF
jgi:hypothetical protein